jgi:hypothetical protein
LRFLTYNTAGSLWVDLDERADATPTFVVRYPTGGEAQASASVTLDTVNTTLSGAASAGATTLSLTSASGVTVGRRYIVGGSEALGGEQVTIKSLSATTATLVRPLQRAASSGATFQSTRVTMSVSALTKIARHYRCEITYAVSSAARPVMHVPFDVTRYEPVSMLQLEDVRAIDSIFAKRLGSGIWWPALREEAWQLILRRIAATKDPGSMVGVIELSQVHAYACRMLAAETAGEEHKDYRDDLRARFQQELEATLAASAYDDDQDQNAESNEAWARSITILRG